MKKHILIKGAVGVLVAGMMSSCASDYLDVKPETSLDSAVVSSTVDGAQLALYGTCASMYAQWNNWETYYAFNGESSFMMEYGDMPGSDYFSWAWGARTATFALNWESMDNNNSWIPLLAWTYNYTLIGQANNVLIGIDEAEGDAAERDFIKAQFLTIRAHAYTHLLQVFAPRWEDSNNGERKCIVLRTTPTTGDTPLVTMNTVLNQIYADLDNAIALYESCGLKRSYKWEPDVNVAKGVYTRVALLKHDYKVAQKMAHEARASFPIMSADDYKSGFCLDNSEYMWNNDPSPDQIYYFAFGSWYACNGPYPCIQGFGPGAINYDFYKQIPDAGGDNVYKSLFFTPDKPLPAGLGASAFWNDGYVDPGSMNMNGRVQRMSVAISAMNRRMKPAVGASWPAANTPTNETGSNTTIVVPFGAQYKFWGTDGFGSGVFPYMRGAELLLAEAEAAYHNGEEATAKSCINELAAKRVSGYTCSKSGNELLNEIRLWRRAELWGEGHSWFDLKRWNLPMERKAWVAGDENSGNIPKIYSIKRDPSYANGWRYAIPMAETQYNKAINLSELY